MKKFLILTLAAASLAQPLMAKDKKKPAKQVPVAEATVAPTPAASSMAGPLAAPWDHVALKDGQEADGKIRGYDAYFLSFELKNATKVQIPWMEVAGVKPAEFSGDTALMMQYLKNEPSEVQSHIQPKSASQARMKALFPGFFLHGYGYKEAGNQDVFLSLAGAEIFGLLVGGFGAARASDPSIANDTQSGEQADAQALAWGGVSIFALSWLIDIVGSGYSADSFNAEHHLAFGLQPQGQAALATASLKF
jgi:hypothetical protein